tara:strand:- start:1080 stop:2315 length:1236 start_codon:yes stop_codon:yes gene_type:complete
MSETFRELMGFPGTSNAPGSQVSNTSGSNPIRWNPLTRKHEVINFFNVPSSPFGPPGNPLNLPTTKVGGLDFKAKKFLDKKSGEILRYPLEALTESTDYLQIDIRSYNSVSSVMSLATGSGSLVSDGQSIRRIVRSNPTSGRRPVSATQDIGENDIRTLSRAGKDKFKSAKGSILLPMPSNIQDGNSVSYSEGNLDGITADIFKGVSDTFNTMRLTGPTLDSIMEKLINSAKNIGNATLFNQNFQNIIKAGLAADAANIPLGGSLTRDAVFARVQGEIINQNVELLFNGVTLRSFKFSFKLTPRGPKEAQQVGLIINTFKRNMAAKVGQDSTFLGTPNVFELTYKRGANSHPFLHSFKQCVLTDMSVNYTGEGTYAVYDDSTPVSMVLELGFKELEPIYDKDYGAEPGVGY